SDHFSRANLEHVAPQLDRSVVADSITKAKSMVGILPANDPLRALIDPSRGMELSYLVFPIIRSDMQPRVLIFLKDGPFTKDQEEDISSREDHFELLIRAIQQAEHVEEIEAFATQGRLAAAGAHEARNRLEILRTLTAHIRETLDKENLK